MDMPIIDTRKPDTMDEVSIPGSINIPYDALVGRMDDWITLGLPGQRL